MRTIEVTEYEINEIYKNKILNNKGEKLKENDIYILKAGSQSAVARIVDQKYSLLKDIRFGKDFEPLSLEQNIYMNYLIDDDIKCIICNGVAGGGKTIISMAYAYESITEGKYQEVIISRPPVAAARKFETGFKPGTLEEKMRPWLKVFYDNLDKAKQYFRNKNIDIQKNIKEQSLEYLKGLTFDNALVIIDEAEDLSSQELKAIMTRIGNNSKLLLLGDEAQTTISDCQNKLSETVEKFNKAKENVALKKQKMFASVEFKKSQRSEFVNFVLEVL